MVTRIITAIAALAVFVGALFAPPIVFTLALAAVIAMMLYECYKATGADTAMKAAGFISAALLLLPMSWITDIDSSANLIFVYIAAAAVILLHMALVVFKHGKRSYKDILSNGFLTFYIVVSMWCIQYTRTFFTTPLMLLIFISAWSCDTFAYFSGRFFGKRKLIPNVSPNKTVAGAVGGVIGSMVCCAVYLLIVYKYFNGFISELSVVKMGSGAADFLVMGIGIGLTGGVFSQLGDLVASSIKRDTGIKDFGWIFPGHGGFMDRFDSVMFISPIILISIIGFMFFV